MSEYKLLGSVGKGFVSKKGTCDLFSGNVRVQSSKFAKNLLNKNRILREDEEIEIKKKEKETALLNAYFLHSCCPHLISVHGLKKTW